MKRLDELEAHIRSFKEAYDLGVILDLIKTIRAQHEALECCFNEQDTDHMTSTTEHDETETWINSDSIRRIAGDAMEQTEKDWGTDNVDASSAEDK